VEGALVALLGRQRLSDDPQVLAAAAVDGIRPRWVVRPGAVEHVAGVLALAHEEELAVVPRGSGSALDLGHPPTRLDIVLDLTGLARVLDDHPADLTVGVEVGLTAGALADRLSARRQWLPVDAPGWGSRTLGGLLATNAVGPLRLRYGSLRDLLLGVRFVQADGVVTWGGARVVKSVTGYDVPKLMVGALGTLGVLVEATLRLHPMPEVEQTWLATFRAAPAAQTFVGLVVDSSLQPNRLEILNELALRAWPARAVPVAVAACVGSVEAAVREQGARLVDLARQAGGQAEPAPERFWERYDRAFAKGQGEVVLQVGTLPSRLAETLQTIERGHQGLGHGAAVRVVGCAAVGSLRVILTGTEPENAAGLVHRLREFLADFDGSVVVQGGPPALRTKIDPWGPVPPAAFNLMRGLKDEFDVARVLNPGRFVGGL
jgi:glycolate oxidase FAD binding subunit